jgi:hypothetical protein
MIRWSVLAAAAVLSALALAASATAGRPRGLPPPPATTHPDGAPRVPGGIGLAVLLDPASPHFGDRVTASVEILVDPRQVDPDSVRLVTDFAPYRAAAPPRASRREAHGLVTIRHRFLLLCLRDPCRPPVGGVRTFRFSPARLSFRRVNGSSGVFTRRWYPLTVASRLSRDLALRGDWQARVFPLPAVGYRFDPAGLSAALFTAAALLAVAGAMLIGRAYGPLVRAELRRRGLARLRATEREVALLRDAVARGDATGQRRALDGLAVALGENGGHDLALGARRLAWSRSDPSAQDSLALAEDVERRYLRAAR